MTTLDNTMDTKTVTLCAGEIKFLVKEVDLITVPYFQTILAIPMMEQQTRVIEFTDVSEQIMSLYVIFRENRENKEKKALDLGASPVELLRVITFASRVLDDAIVTQATAQLNAIWAIASPDDVLVSLEMILSPTMDEILPAAERKHLLSVFRDRISGEEQFHRDTATNGSCLGESRASGPAEIVAPMSMVESTWISSGIADIYPVGSGLCQG